MIVVKDSALEVGWLAWPVAPPSWSLVVALKATFDIPLEGGVCTLAAEQAPITGDRYEDDDVARPLVYSTDLAVHKPCAEVTLVGRAHASRGRAVGSLVAGFRFGPVRKELAIVGDRHWKPGLLGGVSEPVPFTEMPLSWERAFGGPSEPLNPLGRGLDPILVDGVERVPLPNLEDRARMLRSAKARVAPIGTGPIPAAWRARIEKAGTYDAAWQARRWPWFPTDFDWTYFNAAPADQRIVGYWRGDEEIELHQLHPSSRSVHARLPGIAPRCLIAERDGPGHSITEVPLRLDTASIDADAMQVSLVWRGRRATASEHHEELEQIFVTQESLAAPLTPAALARAYHAELGRREAEERGFLAEPMPGGPRG